ncbi:hypothetical protein GOL99_12085 [Sinorhizobium medicae]|nr:hypothetical protein [Sinorhizobium medicae]
MPMDEFPRIKLDDLQSDYPGVFDDARYVDVGIGWLPLVREFVAEALPHDPQLAVHELKEKFGSLRIWCDTEVTVVRLAKGKAEAKSAYTCEVCGADGWIRRPPPGGGYAWWRCLCDDHASPVQRTWGTRRRPTDGTMQFEGQWYRYDRDRDAMLPIDPPEYAKP